jgi:xylulokinase
MHTYLTIDIGTSSAKVSLFREDGSLWLSRGASYPIAYPQAGWAEQDPRDWCQAAAGLCRAVLAVCPSGQAPLCVPVDRAGNPLRPAILWLDRRAAPQAEWLRAQMGDAESVRVSGNLLDAYYGGVKWAWFRQEQPELYARTWKIFQAQTYIAYQLCGSACTDPSHAGMCSPCFNLSEQRWDEAMCERLGLDVKILPELRPSAEVVGQVTRAVAEETGIPAGTPVVCGGGDFACSCLGAGVGEAGQAALMLGTAGNLLVPGLIKTDPRLINTVHVTGEGLSLGGVLAGEAITWFRELMGGAPLDELEAEAAGVRAGADGLVFLPYLMGERTPVWDAQARGHLYRAVLEGIACAFREMAEILAQCGRPVSEVVAINGGARSPLWRQIFADVLGVPVRWRRNSPGTALGAAYLAALGAGDVRGWDGLAAWLEPPIDTLPDGKNTAVYAERYGVYRQLYGRVKDLF